MADLAKDSSGADERLKKVMYLHNDVERPSEDGLSKVFRCSDSKDIWDLEETSD